MVSYLVLLVLLMYPLQVSPLSTQMDSTVPLHAFVQHSATPGVLVLCHQVVLGQQQRCQIVGYIHLDLLVVLYLVVSMAVQFVVSH